MIRIFLFFALTLVCANANLQYTITPLFGNSSNTVAVGETFVAGIQFANLPDTASVWKFQYRFVHKPANMFATYYSPSAYLWTKIQGHYAEIVWSPVMSQVNTSDSFQLQICDSTGSNCGSTYYSPTIQVIPGKVGMVFYDQAASFTKQVDIGTWVKNYSSSSLNLSGAWYDYYVQASQTANRISPQVWTGDSKMCIQLLSCGGNKYIVRHQMGQGILLAPNGEYPSPSSPNKVGYFEHGATAIYIPLSEKVLPGSSQDPSYPFNSNSYLQASFARNAHYNDAITLFRNDGVIISGTGAPSGFGSCAQMDISNSSAGSCAAPNPIPADNHAPTLTVLSASDTIFGGEDYAAFLDYSDADGDSVTVNIVNNPGWIEVGTVDNYLPIFSRYNWVHSNSQYLKRYIRSKYDSIRGTSHVAPGTYSYTIEAKDAYGTVTSVSKSVTVKLARWLPLAPAYGVGVLFMDETWALPEQLDLAYGFSGIATSTITLANPSLDYFLDSSLSEGWQTMQWWSGVSGQDAIRSTVNCGSGRYRFRVTLPWTFSVEAGKTSPILPKMSFVGGNGSILSKSTDYSYPSEYERRRFRYNSKILLHNGNGQLLWGTPPTWASQCATPLDLVPTGNPIDTTTLCQITVQAGSGGSTLPLGTSMLPASRNVSLVATPSSGKIFDRWTVILGSGVFSNPFSSATAVSANCGLTVQASFANSPSGGLSVPDGTDSCFSFSGTQSSATQVFVTNRTDSIWILLTSRDTNQFVSERMLYLDDSSGGVGAGSWNRRIRFSGSRPTGGTAVWSISEDKFQSNNWAFYRQLANYASNSRADTVPGIGFVGIGLDVELKLGRSLKDSLKWWFDSRGNDIGSDSFPKLALRGAALNGLVLDGLSCDWFGTCTSSSSSSSSSSSVQQNICINAPLLSSGTIYSTANLASQCYRLPGNSNGKGVIASFYVDNDGSDNFGPTEFRYNKQEGCAIGGFTTLSGNGAQANNIGIAPNNDGNTYVIAAGTVAGTHKFHIITAALLNGASCLMTTFPGQSASGSSSSVPASSSSLSPPSSSSGTTSLCANAAILTSDFIYTTTGTGSTCYRLSGNIFAKGVLASFYVDNDGSENYGPTEFRYNKQDGCASGGFTTLSGNGKQANNIGIAPNSDGNTYVIATGTVAGTRKFHIHTEAQQNNATCLMTTIPGLSN